MSDEVQSLRDTLLQKEHIQGFLSTLEKLRADGSVNDEQYATLKSGYHEKMMAAVSEIARVKNELAGQLLSAKQKLNHCKTELKQLKARYDIGELSSGESQSAQQQVDNRVEDIRTEIANLQRLTEAKASAQVVMGDLAEYAEQVAASMASQRRATLKQQQGAVPHAPVSPTIGGDMVPEDKEESEQLFETQDWLHELASHSGDASHRPVNVGGPAVNDAGRRSRGSERKNGMEGATKNWFRRHLNWTLVLCGYVGCFVPPVMIGLFMGLYEMLAGTTLSETAYDIVGYLTALPVLIWVTVWHLKQKSRSMWHLLWLLWLPGYVVLPCLINESQVEANVHGTRDF